MMRPPIPVLVAAAKPVLWLLPTIRKWAVVDVIVVVVGIGRTGPLGVKVIKAAVEAMDEIVLVVGRGAEGDRLLGDTKEKDDTVEESVEVLETTPVVEVGRIGARGDPRLLVVLS